MKFAAIFHFQITLDNFGRRVSGDFVEVKSGTGSLDRCLVKFAAKFHFQITFDNFG